MRSSLMMLAICVFVTCCGRGENWPAWRGPRGDGTSLEKNIPTSWNSTNHVAWKTAVPGEGHSSPIVWGDRVFLTTALKESEERVVLCIDRREGKQLWQQTVLRSPLEAKNQENSYASATPATDGERVYVAFLDRKDVVVSAFYYSGKQQWQVRPGQFYSQWGFSHTPVLFAGMVIVCCDSKGENFIVALDRKDGRTIWKVQRENPTQSYSAPLLRQMCGRMQLVIPGNKGVTSYDPQTGKQLWVVDGPSEDCLVTPVFNETAELLLSASSWPKRVVLAIKPDGEGNVTASKIAWTSTDAAPYVPSPLSCGEWFFTSSFASKEGFCLEARTGKVMWREKMGLHHASPVCANGLVYFLNDEGVAHVVKAGPNYELVSRNELGEKTYASPALLPGELFIRGFKHLYCIRDK